MEWDWSPYLSGGALRPDAMTGLRPEFNNALAALFQNAPEDIRGGLQVYSAYRSPEVQAGLWENALAKYGSEQAARKWVAPPGRSRHNMGMAADLRFGNDAAREWVHQNAGQYGLHFPMDWEPWHIEIVGSRDGQPVYAAVPGPAPDGRQMQQGQPEAPQNALAQFMPQTAMQDPAAFMRAPNRLAEMQPYQTQNYLTRRLG